MKEPRLLLSNQICFLVHRLDRAIGACYRTLLRDLGLTYPQYLAMLVLWEHGELEVGDLCRILSLDTGTVSPLIKRLEKSGLLVRRRRKNDERVVAVTLTEKGKAMKKRALGVPGTLASCLLDGVEEYSELKGTLSNLLERIEERSRDLPGTPPPVMGRIGFKDDRN